MEPDSTDRRPNGAGLGAVFFAWAIHTFTASGIVLGLLAVVALLEGDVVATFLWLGCALAIDSIDGTLARWAGVESVTPQFDGATLDSVVDFFTYATVPALMIYRLDFVPAGFSSLVAGGILLVSCYTFANLGLKAHDYYFVGFPALWNLLVFYLYVLKTGPWTNLIVIAVCCVLTFVPTKYVHPFRVRKGRFLTLPVTVLWALASWWLVRIDPGDGGAWEASPWIFWLWVAASIYFAALSVWRSLELRDVSLPRNGSASSGHPQSS